MTWREDAPRTRVTYVINDLARAGAETQLALLATHLDRERFEPRIVLIKERNDFSDALERAGVPVVALRRRGPGDAGVLLRLRQALCEAPADLIHSYLFLANWMTALAAPRRARLVLSQRCSYEKQLSALLRRVARWSHRRADRLVVNSAAIADEERRAGFPAGRLACVPNGALLPDLATAPPVHRSDLGLPPGRIVLALGQLVWAKGHRFLLDAWPQVVARHPDTVLVLVGEGPERRALEAHASRLGIEASVRFLGFRSPSSPYLQAADLFVHPSLTEGMPNAVLEAMAWSRPIVATEADGVPELVGDSARLVPPGDVAGLAQAVAGLLGDRSTADRLAAAARSRAESTYSVAALVARTTAVYAEILAAGPRAVP
jgi:glycosyltransferase involved in cell wall biosynthesis